MKRGLMFNYGSEACFAPSTFGASRKTHLKSRFLGHFEKETDVVLFYFKMAQKSRFEVCFARRTKSIVCFTCQGLVDGWVFGGHLHTCPVRIVHLGVLYTAQRTCTRVVYTGVSGVCHPTIVYETQAWRLFDPISKIK